MDHYKSALDKIKLSETEKNKAKALYYAADVKKEDLMDRKKRGIRWFASAAIAAGLALFLTANAAFTSQYQKEPENTRQTTASHSFTVTAYAKELTKTGSVYNAEYASAAGGLCGNGEGQISFGFDFPVLCKGENIDTITYTIRNGAFCITNPKGKNIVISGEKLNTKMNAVVGYAASEETEDNPYDENQYRSFTVNYEKQSDPDTCIYIIGESDPKQALDVDITNMSGIEKKQLNDRLIKDMEITCTVSYQDGTTETKQIVVSNQIVRASELEGAPADDDREMVVRCFSIE